MTIKFEELIEQATETEVGHGCFGERCETRNVNPKTLARLVATETAKYIYDEAGFGSYEEFLELILSNLGIEEDGEIIEEHFGVK